MLDEVHELERQHTDQQGDSAADQGSAVQRHVFADFYERVLVNEHVLGERTKTRKLTQKFITLMQSGWLLGCTIHLGFLAEHHAPGDAVLAMTAECGETGDHVIARLHVGHILANRFDDPG